MSRVLGGGLALAGLVLFSDAATGQRAPTRPGAPATGAYVTAPDSIRFWYRVVGHGRETVIIPAALYHRTVFDRLAVGRRLVLYDPRGRGMSDTVPPGKTSLQHDMADLELLRKAVGADSFAVIAWSALGVVYYSYALDHPGRVTQAIPRP